MARDMQKNPDLGSTVITPEEKIKAEKLIRRECPDFEMLLDMMGLEPKHA